MSVKRGKPGLGRPLDPRGFSRRDFLKMGGGGLAGAALLGTAGCGIFGGGGGQQQGGGGGRKTFNTYFEADVLDLNSITTTDSYSFNVLNNVMEGLYRLDENHEPTPAMAEGVEISEDELTYTFTLRDGITWSNGDPVTAGDFMYAWMRALNPDTAGDYAFIIAQFVEGATAFNAGEGSEGDVGVAAPDDKTLEVTLAAPAPFFLGLTSFVTYLPLNQQFVEQQGDDFALGADSLLYNGPYTMTEFDASSQVVFVKNKDYWDADNVDVDEVNVRIIKEDETALNLYESGELDVFALAGQYFDQFQGSEEYVTAPYFLTYFLYLNADDPVIGNQNIRKALQIGFDREAVVNRIQNNGYVPAVGLVPPGVAGPGNQTFREAVGDTLPAFDPDQARQFYQRGVEELGEEPTIEVLVSDDDTTRDVGTFLQDQFSKNLGANVNTQVTTFEDLLEREDTGDYQIAASSWIADYNDPMTYMDLWLSDSSFNRVGFSNERYDELIRGAQTNTDNGERMSAMEEAEKILLEDAAIGPISHGVYARIQKPYVTRNVDHPYGAADEYKLLRLESK